MRRSVLALAASSLALAVVVGCGHKATPEECQLLVDKSVELTMKELARDAGPEEIAEVQEKQRKQLEGELKDCQGRRVTDAMIKCARAAQTSDELAACFK